MKRNIKIWVQSLLVLTALTPMISSAAVWESCDRWGAWLQGGYGYKLWNNVWGGNAGWQCMWANSGANWGVTCNHGNSGGIKSYPNSDLVINRYANSLNGIGTWFSVQVPNYGAHCTAFDIWASDRGITHEIMIWMNKQGAVGPIGGTPFIRNVYIGGHSWDIYGGKNGSINVASFVRTSNTSEATVDLKAIFDYFKSKGWWANDAYIYNVQFGFEITNTGSQNAGFVCNWRTDWQW